MLKKVQVIAKRKGRDVVVGEAVLDFDPVDPESGVVVETTMYSDKVMSAISSANGFSDTANSK